MTRVRNAALLTAWLLGLVWTCPRLGAEIPSAGPDFKEVYGLVREHLADANDAELNRVAVQSFLSALAPRVMLVDSSTTGQVNNAVLVNKTSLFDGPIAYLRIGQVDSGLDKAVRAAWNQTVRTNKVSGLVIDLRFAGGTDYAAAVAAADLFIKKQQPLLDWGKGMVRSTEKAETIDVPLAILVNQQTTSAAEALAAILRQAGVGLIVGSRTAGQALISQDYALTDGRQLRIATTPIQLGDGSSLASQGIKPDIVVEVSPASEKAYFADAFKEISSTGPRPGATNTVAGPGRVRRPRFNEAELVRERRDGVVSDAAVAGTDDGDSDKPVVRDPVLVRALDFLKGLSVVRQTRS